MDFCMPDVNYNTSNSHDSVLLATSSTGEVSSQAPTWSLMHETFQCDTVLSTPRTTITGIHAYSNKLLLVDANHILTHYQVPEPSAAHENAGESKELKTLQSVKNFCKSKPVRLHAIKETEMLLVLVDSYLSIFSLVTLELQQRLNTTKGATSFSVWSGVDHSSGIPILSTHVAVCVKRQLLLFTWLDAEFEGERHFDCPDRAKEAAFLTGTCIVVGMTNDFVSVDTTTGTVEAMPLPISSFGAVSTTMGYLGSRAPRPILTRTSDQMLLVRDVQSSFIDAQCNILETKSVNWQTAPEFVGYTYPYLIVVLKSKVEVRNSKSGTLLQNFDLAGIQILNDGKNLFLSSAHKVIRLTPVSYAEQVEKLIATDQLMEALSLLSILDSVLLDDKAALVRRTKELRARDLFHQEQFDASMDLFSESWSIPSVVVKMLPRLEDSRTESTLTNHSDVSVAEAKEQTLNADKSQASLDTAASSQKVTEIVPALNDPDSPVSRAAYRSLSTYLARTRRLLTRFLSNPPSASSEDQYYSPWPQCMPLTSTQIEGELGIADTSLLRIYIMISPGLVGSLVRLPNRCDPAVVKDYLVEEDRWKELVDFYYSKNLHTDALTLAKDKDAVNMAIQYLQRLDVTNWNVITAFAPWVLTTSTTQAKAEGQDDGERDEADDNPAMDIFTEASREAESFDREQVVDFLTSIDSKFGVEYLEFLINTQNDSNPRFSEALITLYISSLQVIPLLQFLSSERNSSVPTRIYSKLPHTPDFYEARAVVLAMMHNLAKALEIFVYKIRVPHRSEAFAASQYAKFPDSFEMLLTLYLTPSKAGEDVMVAEALDLLARHGPRLSSSLILDTLPPSITVSAVTTYFTSSLRSTLSTYHSRLIESKLRDTALVNLQVEVTRKRQRSVLVTDDRVCASCHKRLGNSVVAVFPDSRVVHYGCQRRYELESHAQVDV